VDDAELILRVSLLPTTQQLLSRGGARKVLGRAFESGFLRNCSDHLMRRVSSLGELDQMSRRHVRDQCFAHGQGALLA
jgi:hypothetical protein